MSDDWDSYLCEVDGRLASMFVDLGLFASTPVPALPCMGRVVLRLGSPNPDGMSSNEEFEALMEVEDALTKQLVEGGAVYVGRCTTNGVREFHFYMARSEDWKERVAACMRAFPGYVWEAQAQGDSEWMFYRDYLYPDAAQWQAIANRRQCEALQREGDALMASREIDHVACFPDTGCRDGFVEAAQGLGFAVRTLGDSGDPFYPFSATVRRLDVPRLDRIDEVTGPLFDLAVSCGGRYEGWATTVVA